MYVLHGAIKRLNAYLPFTNHWLVLAASLLVSLATGTMFAYSVYSTQLAQRCGLTTSETANLNVASTLGSAIGGIGSGMLADYYGTQIPILLSCVGNTFGYWWIYILYNKGEKRVFSLLFAMLIIGVSTVAGYFTSIKAVSLHFPNYKGSVQGVVIATFAISSVIYLAISTKFYHDDTGGFLHFIFISTGILLFVGFIFIRVEGYLDERESESDMENQNQGYCETTSLSRTPSDQGLSKPQTEESRKEALRNPYFWYHYLLLSCSQGVGQMYIFSIGFILKAIHIYYTHLGSTTDIPSLQSLQSLHVSLISVSSFAGRFSAGFQSDILLQKYGYQRHWVLVIGNLIMLIANMLYSFDLTSVSPNIRNVNICILFLSCLIGYAYGLTFASYPAIIADLFGMKYFSFLWGVVYTGSLFGVTFLQKTFAHFYDKHTDLWDDILKDVVCTIGAACYNETFRVSTALVIGTIVLTVLYIWLRQK